jgi:hypothetical protein
MQECSKRRSFRLYIIQVIAIQKLESKIMCYYSCQMVFLYYYLRILNFPLPKLIKYEIALDKQGTKICQTKRQ